jgi:uncharacterized protein YndB with AHSA1/START domain
MQSTTNSRVVNASVNEVFAAFCNEKALEVWLAPEGMKGKIHDFNFKPGGGYTMSLYYNDDSYKESGKTKSNEDRFASRYLEIVPEKKIVEAINFESDDPSFKGEMIMEVTFESKQSQTEVIFHFERIPIGITPKDNEAGTLSTLEKLAKYVEL